MQKQTHFPTFPRDLRSILSPVLTKDVPTRTVVGSMQDKFMWLWSISVVDSPSGERAPTFMQPPGTHSTTMVLKGDTMELECIADGLWVADFYFRIQYLDIELSMFRSWDCIFFFSPTPDISWSKVNGELPSGRFSFHSFQKTLKITEMTEADGGDYRCFAKNRLGSNHHIITVVVKGLSLHLKIYRSQLILF